jgi:hypothetical protein
MIVRLEMGWRSEMIVRLGMRAPLETGVRLDVQAPAGVDAGLGDLGGLEACSAPSAENRRVIPRTRPRGDHDRRRV